VLHVAVLAGIYVVLTLSLNLVTGFCGQFSLGHAGFYGIGAYTAAILAVNWGSPFVLNLLAAAAASGAAGFLIGLPTCAWRITDGDAASARSSTSSS
jgi:branched-chain amino acid transport system permease protein